MLRHGDVVDVRSASEILATLDDTGALDGLPFMEEMLRSCGRRFTVDKRADKICDTIHYTGSRRLPDSVLLMDRRCDGADHDGCEAECRVFWKEAWLRPIDSPEPPARVSPEQEAAAVARLRDLLPRHRKREAEVDGKRVTLHRCQNTELFKASTHLRTLDPRPYVHEYRTGNVSLERLVRVGARAAVKELLDRTGLLPPFIEPKPDGAPRPEPLGLQPGDWVRVRPKEQIAATLNEQGKNRGLWFDVEMVPACGKVFQVRRRVRRIIDEVSCRMIEFKKSDCVTLEGVACSGDLSLHRWLCPREIIPYWREAWLERVPPPPAAALGHPAESNGVAATPAPAAPPEPAP